MTTFPRCLPGRRVLQRGFAVVAAIFILVVLAALASFITLLSSSQHAGSALDVQGAQAYRAAQAGIDWGLYQALKGASPCAASSDIGGVGGMSVTVHCTQVAAGAAVEAGLGTIYQISATACNLPGAGSPQCPGDAANPNYVERRLTAMAEK